VVDPATGERRSAAPGEYVNEVRAREILRASLQSIGYDPADINAVPGSLKDLASTARLRVIIDTNVKMARGYGNWKQGQTSAILDQWPAQELVRVESRIERRDWHGTWASRGGKVSAGVGLDGKYGRLVARKDDGIWSAISRFGLPYPPFDYMSGVGVRDVDRDTAMRLGVIDRDTQIEPEERPFNQDLEAAAPADPAKQAALFDAIMSAMGAAVKFRNGVMILDAIEAGGLP
jgi:hypothetical protein